LSSFFWYFPANRVVSRGKIWQKACSQPVVNLRFIVVATFCLVGVRSIRADENFSTLTIGHESYTNVTVTMVTRTDVYFTYDNGKNMANAKLKNLAPALQKHFHYDPVKAGEVEKKRVQANAEYHHLVVSQPAGHPPDESRSRSAVVARASLARTGVRGALNLTVMSSPPMNSPAMPETTLSW
jgi:hypothetical protein